VGAQAARALDPDHSIVGRWFKRFGLDAGRARANGN
jgi:hypothetical protein